jgi:2-polyprenyl-6-methoxyphenol hydroxylase-like FAD-dependent oxidoreductase
VPDITLIGAGPAGSAAALMLARLGWCVTLIEQSRFPRDKVCGECVSAVGVDVLERLGVLPSLCAAGGVWLCQAIIHAGDGDCALASLPRPMLGISRHVLDKLLLETARGAGVRIRQPARCEMMQATAAGLTLRVRDLECNQVESLTPALVILADGRSALPHAPPAATGDIGIKSHWTGIPGPRDAIELFGCAGCYGGLAPIEGGRWNCAFSVPARRVRAHRGNLEALFMELTHENQALAQRLTGAIRIGPWLASPLPRFAVRKKWPPRVIPIGNAAAAMEPIGGEGIGLALRSAELAVAALHAAGGFWDESAARRLGREFASLWNLRRLTCRTAALVVSSTNAVGAAVEWMRTNEGLVSLAIRALGKGSRQLFSGADTYVSDATSQKPGKVSRSLNNSQNLDSNVNNSIQD